MIPVLLLFTLLALAAPRPAHARQGAEPLQLSRALATRDLPALRTALRAMPDPTLLRVLERDLATSRPIERTAAADEVARGFLALRLFELERDRDDLKRARAAFDRAGKLDPASVWARYGQALALVHEAERDPPTIVAGAAFARALGLDPRSRARRSLQQTLEMDAHFLPAAELLVEVALELHDRAALDDAGAALRSVLERGGGDADARLAFARAATALGDFESAAGAAHEVVLEDGVESVEARHALAVALLQLQGREDAGASFYFEAVEYMTPPLAARLRADLAVIARASELTRWDSLDDTARRAWLRTFWDVRAAAAGVPVANRLAEHYRRLAAANERFPRRVRWGATPRNALKLKRLDDAFDDRGVILMRHGEPIAVIRSVHSSSALTESWVYRSLEGQSRMFHFMKPGDYPEWLLMYNVPCDAQWVTDRAPYEPRLRIAMSRCDPAALGSLSAELRQDVYAALRTDSHAPHFARELPFHYDLHTFRGDEERTELAAVFAVTGARLARHPDAAVDVSLIVVDTIASEVARRDTLVRSATIDADAAMVWGSVTVLAAPTRGAMHRLVIRDGYDPALGQLHGGPLLLTDYRGDTLMVSDIVLATSDSAGGLRRGDVVIRPVPSAEFEGGELRVYYELYNLPPATLYTTELVIERVRGVVTRTLTRLFGGDPAVKLRFEEEARDTVDGTQRELRRVTTGLEPGGYRLRVRVSSQASAGGVVVREREFAVRRGR